MTDGPPAPQNPLNHLRRLISERRALSAGIAAAAVVILVVVLVLTLGGGGGKSPTATPTGSVPPASPSTSASGGSTPVAGKPAVPATGAYLGVYAAPHTTLQIGAGVGKGGREDITGDAIAKLEAQTGTTFAIDHRYFNWDDPFSVELMRNTAAHGRIPFLAFQTTNGGPTYRQIADGQGDDSLNARADAAKAFGKPMFVAFQWEPNDSINGKKPKGSAEDYVAAWRHIVTLFRDRGATNVAFVYVQTAASFRQGSPLDDQLYPGSDYIDWVAADGYNFFGCPSKKAGWTPFSQVFRAFNEWGKTKNKPMMIAELGVSEDPSNPNRKAEWYRQAAEQLKSFPGIKAVVYYNGAPQCANYVDTSSESLAGFQELAKSPYFIRRTSG